MSKDGTTLTVMSKEFDYSALEGQVAERVRDAAGRIKEKVKNSIENIVEVGRDLLAVKEELDHGQFGAWLKAEFGWTDRTARNFMAVAERFGKTEMISDLAIQPTAAYLLAAPSTPDEARQTAVERAEGGEQITAKVAKQILAKAKKKGKRKPKALPADKLGLRLVKVLERYKERWKPTELSELARQLREFADALEEPQRGGRKKAKA